MSSCLSRCSCQIPWHSLTLSPEMEAKIADSIRAVINAVKRYFGYHVVLSEQQVKTLRDWKIAPYKIKENDPSLVVLKQGLDRYLVAFTKKRVAKKDNPIEIATNDFIEMFHQSSGLGTKVLAQVLTEYWAKSYIESKDEKLDEFMKLLVNRFLGPVTIPEQTIWNNLVRARAELPSLVESNIRTQVPAVDQEDVRSAFIPELNKEALVSALGKESSIKLLTSIFQSQIEASLNSMGSADSLLVEMFIAGSGNSNDSNSKNSRELERLIEIVIPEVTAKVIDSLRGIDWPSLFNAFLSDLDDHIDRVEAALMPHRRAKELIKKANKIIDEGGFAKDSDALFARTLLATTSNHTIQEGDLAEYLKTDEAQEKISHNLDTNFYREFPALERDRQNRFLLDLLLPHVRSIFSGEFIVELIGKIAADPVLSSKSSPYFHLLPLATSLNTLVRILFVRTVENQLSAALLPQKIEDELSKEFLTSLIQNKVLPKVLVAVKNARFRQEMYLDISSLMEAVKTNGSEHFDIIKLRFDRSQHRHLQTLYVEERERIRSAIRAVGADPDNASYPLIEEVIQVYRSSLPSVQDISIYQRLVRRLLIQIGGLLPDFPFLNGMIGRTISSSLYPYSASHVELFTIIGDALKSEEGPPAVDAPPINDQIKELAEVVYRMLIRPQEEGTFGSLRVEALQEVVGFDSTPIKEAIERIVYDLILQRPEVNRSLINGLAEVLFAERRSW